MALVFGRVSVQIRQWFNTIWLFNVWCFLALICFQDNKVYKYFTTQSYQFNSVTFFLMIHYEPRNVTCAFTGAVIPSSLMAFRISDTSFRSRFCGSLAPVIRVQVSQFGKGMKRFTVKWCHILDEWTWMFNWRKELLRRFRLDVGATVLELMEASQNYIYSFLLFIFCTVVLFWGCSGAGQVGFGGLYDSLLTF